MYSFLRKTKIAFFNSFTVIMVPVSILELPILTALLAMKVNIVTFFVMELYNNDGFIFFKVRVVSDSYFVWIVLENVVYASALNGQ